MVETSPSEQAEKSEPQMKREALTQENLSAFNAEPCNKRWTFKDLTHLPQMFSDQASNGHYHISGRVQTFEVSAVVCGERSRVK